MAMTKLLFALCLGICLLQCFGFIIVPHRASKIAPSRGSLHGRRVSLELGSLQERKDQKVGHKGVERFQTVDYKQERSDRLESEKSTSIVALRKLIEKQRSELEDSERLLRQVSGVSTLSFKGIEIGNRDQVEARTSSIQNAADYGFISRSHGCVGQLARSEREVEPLSGYGPPRSFWSLGWEQFFRNWNAMRGEYADEPDTRLTDEQLKMRKALSSMTLNITAIWEREKAGPEIAAPWIVKIPYISLCIFLDKVFDGRYIPARFFFLETVARIPYFSYISMLHAYESLGFWRRSSQVKRIHFAEEWNEFNHLLIMESLGGDQRWWVRFLAQHSALAYYVALNFLFLVSPTMSYTFSEMLETHAVHTYGQFLDENEELLKTLPPSMEAVEYYTIGAADPLFNEYQTSRGVEELRRPGDNMNTLYDVFVAIREDERDHVDTMEACLDPEVAVRSPAMERNFLTGVALIAACTSVAAGSGMLDVAQISELLGGGGNAVMEAADGAGVTEASGSVLSSVAEGVIAALTATASSGANLIQEGGEDIVMSAGAAEAETLPLTEAAMAAIVPLRSLLLRLL